MRDFRERKVLMLTAFRSSPETAVSAIEVRLTGGTKAPK